MHGKQKECIEGKELLKAGLDQVAAEGDVDVHVIAVDGVITLSLVEAHPNLVILSQLQHQALALHDASVAGLSIEDDLFLVVPHDVHVGLLEIPSMDIEAEKVEASHITVELALKHVKVAIEIHKDGVKDQGLVPLTAVEGLLAAY